jgi:hypothetical protein
MVIVRVARVCVVGDRVGLIFRVEFVLVDCVPLELVLVEFVLLESVLVEFVLLESVLVEGGRLVHGSRRLIVPVDFVRVDFVLVGCVLADFGHGGGGLGKRRRLCRHGGGGLGKRRRQRAGFGGRRRRRLLAGLESLRRDHVQALGRQELLPGPDLLARQRSVGATGSCIGGVVTVDRAHCSLPFLC